MRHSFRMRATFPIAILAAVPLLATAGEHVAYAAGVSATLTSLTGEGTADRSLLCGAGDGQSWRYAYAGPVTPASSPLAGGWASSIEVHEAASILAGGVVQRRAYIPATTGRARISTARGGTATISFAGGSCGTGALNLNVATPGDAPVATGTLPYVVQDGTGPLRHSTGSGTLSLTLTMGPGAANPASVAMAGTLNVLQPSLGAAASTGQYKTIRDYLARKLTVTLPVTNAGPAATVGDAFDVRVASASTTGGTISGAPQKLGEIDAAASTPATLTLVGALPGQSYTITGTIDGFDATDLAVGPVSFTSIVSAPLLPELAL